MGNARKHIEDLLDEACLEAGPWLIALRKVASQDLALSDTLFECFWKADAPSLHWSMACWLALCDPRVVRKGPMATSWALARSGSLAWRSNLLWIPKNFEEREWMDHGMAGLLEGLGEPVRLGMGVDAMELRAALDKAAHSGAWDSSELQVDGWSSPQGWRSWSHAVRSSLERVEIGEAAWHSKRSGDHARSL